jgi:hypothetical protein
MDQQLEARQFVCGQPHFPSCLIVPQTGPLPLLNSNHHSHSPRFGDLRISAYFSDNRLPLRRSVASFVLRCKLGQVGLPLPDGEPQMLKPDELRGNYIGAEHN